MDAMQVFSGSLSDRFAASIGADEATRGRLAAEVEGQIGSPRLGTSGAANAYVILIGSEFGGEDSPGRPHYSERTMGRDGWTGLWQLRIGEPNPHFDPRWSSLRETTVLWKRLYDWLPDAFGDARVAHSMFAWANLAVTKGGEHSGTAEDYRAGMTRHVAKLIVASRARIVVTTNQKTEEHARGWAIAQKAMAVTIGDMEAWQVGLPYGTVLLAKVGHPSRGVSRADFIRRMRTLLARASGKDMPLPRNDWNAGPAVPTEPGPQKRREATMATHAAGSGDVLAVVMDVWGKLGGTTEERKGAGIAYVKLLHPRYHPSKACLVVDLTKAGAFDYFVHVRVRDLTEWRRIYSEVTGSFDPYLPESKGIKLRGRHGRVESKLVGSVDARTLERFLTLTRDYWLSRLMSAERPGQ